MANQTECSRHEQRSVIKFLLAEKCKQYELYRRMCDVYGEACFRKKYVYKWAKHGFTTVSSSQSIIHGIEILWHSGKEKVLGTVVNKEGHADAVLWDMKGPITIDFFEKGATIDDLGSIYLIHWMTRTYKHTSIHTPIYKWILKYF